MVDTNPWATADRCEQARWCIRKLRSRRRPQMRRFDTHPLRHAATTLALVLALGAVGIPSAQAASDGMVSWASSAFEGDPAYGVSGYSIIASNPDGSALVPLTVNGEGSPNQDVAARWSPDGNRLAVAACPSGLFGCNSGVNIDLVNADGTGRQTWV